MRSDQIEGGQWFHGKIYPEKCDLSPSGGRLVYFGGKFRAAPVQVAGFPGIEGSVGRLGGADQPWCWQD
jgi:hypothetical protein